MDNEIIIEGLGVITYKELIVELAIIAIVLWLCLKSSKRK